MPTSDLSVPGMPHLSILHCSFCGKHKDEVILLIQGPLVQICEECVELCVDIVEDHTEIKIRKGKE